MKKFTIYILIFLSMLLMGSCHDKYAGLGGDITIKGSAYIVDANTTNASPIPLAARQLYLGISNGTNIDTSTYIYQCNTDSAGVFTVVSLKNKMHYSLFTHFVMNGAEYSGAANFTPDNPPGNVMSLTLIVHPHYQNGMTILFTDIFAGPISNLPFRLYTSRVAALADSTKYAFVNNKSNINGYFAQYNVPAVKYYIISTDTIANVPLKVFDSVTITATDVKNVTVELH